MRVGGRGDDPAAAPSGSYVIDEEVRDPSAAGRDDVLAEALWDRTESLLATPAA